MSDVELVVNGRKVRRTVEDRTLLVHFLREELGLTGTHVGCDTSQCGACVVHVDGQAVKSCTCSPPRRRADRLDHRGTRPGGASCTRCRRRSRSITACNAASARRA